MTSSLVAIITARSFACLTAALLVACGGGGGGPVTPPAVPVLTVFAGLLQGAGSRDGEGVAAQFNQPGGAVQDGAGTIFVADTGNHTIRRVTQQGSVSTFAGRAGLAGNTDGTGAAARFSSPMGLALDATGNLYVADSGNHAVRKISAAGLVTTVAILPDAPLKLALNGASGMYALSAKVVRKLAADGTVVDLPVKPGAGVQYQVPVGLGFSGIAVDAGGNLFVADAAVSGYASGVGTVRKLDPQGRALPFGPADDGLVRIAFPVDIALDGAGNLLVINNGYWIATPRIAYDFRTLLRLAPDGTSAVIAGANEVGRTVDGPAAQARFDDPRVIAAGPGGQVAVIETGRNAVRLVDPQGAVSTLAGGDGAGQLDGAAAQARLDGPAGIAAAPDGGLYVAERAGRNVRQISPAGGVTTLVPARPSLGRLANVAVSRAGTVYVMQTAVAGFGRGVFSVAAGTYTYVLNTSPSAFSEAIAVGASGNLVLPEEDGIKAVMFDGSKGTLAAGISATALAADASGAVYFATRDGTVGVASASGQVAILAGMAGQRGDQDGSGVLARFRLPKALAAGADGIFYVADGLRIRRVTVDGNVTTIADLATMDGVEPVRAITGLAWINGVLFATLKNAVVRIAPGS